LSSHSHSRFSFRAVATAAAVVAAGALAACADAPTLEPNGTPAGQPPADAALGGGYRLTISDIGTDRQASRIVADGPAPAAGAAAPRASRVGGGTGLVAQAPTTCGLTPRPSALEFQFVATGSYTYGTRGDAGAYRYVYTVYRVRNATGAPLSNLSLLATATSATVGQTAIASVRLAGNVDPGANTAAVLALGMAPAGASHPGPTGVPIGLRTDVLQIFSEADIAGAGLPAGFTPLPYAFSVIDTLSDGRTIPATASGTYPGIILFAFHLPLQATASQDVFTFDYRFFAVTDAETRVTESIQERDATSSSAVLARANTLGAAGINLFRGSLLGANGLARTVCTIRTAGTQASPTQLLGGACSIEYLSPAITLPANVTVAAGATQQITSTVNVRPGFNPPTLVTYASANRNVARVSRTGVVSGVAPGTTTIYASLLSTGAYLYTVPVTVTP
jgi:hypothetical protein